ncbi:patatin-like phospholipase domain-containing protein 6 isoform X2 [Corticium candelabrum]|uniref:patatin-like phospholipase domain-containing protein 6 isoform X2 n=1 Tax=Corticium candelabrum TaxID=121492 RepID=UPI002E273948|nr:patatin-like phospholipase domain-containing protein 6 isoform X2 [Corticium candelabrum]
METKLIPAGAGILPNGQIDESIYVVQSGRLSVFLQDKDGSEHCLKDICTGESIHSLLSILDVLTGHSAPVSVSARAVETTTVLKLPASAFKYLFSKYPDSLVRFVQIILLRLQRVTFLALHKYLGLSSELIKSEVGSTQKSTVGTHFEGTESHAGRRAVFDLPGESEGEESSDTEPERDIDQTSPTINMSHPNAPAAYPINDQPLPSLSDRQRSISVPIEINKLQNLSQGTQHEDNNTIRGSHPDLLVASSGSDFELAYEKAGLRCRLKETLSVGHVSDVGSTGKFQLGDESESNEDEREVFVMQEETDVEQVPSPEESDPALKAAVQRLAKAIQLSDADDHFLAGICSLSNLPERKVIVKEGSLDSSLLFVLSGSLEVVQLAVDKTEERFMYAVEHDELAGELAVVTGEPSFFTIRVRQQASLLIITKANFYRLLRDHPRAVLSVAYMFIQRSCNFVRQIDYALDWMQLQAGKALYRQGERATNCNIVLSGRLRSVVKRENGEKEIVAEYGKGDSVGVVELLTHSERATTVHAVRDTELAQIPDGLLNTIKRKHPQVVTHLIHLLGNKLLFTYQKGSRVMQEPLLGDRPQTVNLTTVAVVPVSSDVPLDSFTRELNMALNTIETSLRLTKQLVLDRFGVQAFDSMQEYRLLNWLGQQEDNHRIVLYQTEFSMSPWTHRCIRQADCILIVGLADSDPAPGEIESQLEHISVRAQKELVLLHRKDSPGPCGTLDWLAARGWCSAHYHIRCPDRILQGDPSPRLTRKKLAESDGRSDFARLARHLTGTSIGLVLGGGGAKGFAHVGILKALEEYGIQFDMVGGTSIGAFIGGLYGQNQDADKLRELIRPWSKRMAAKLDKLFDLTYPITAMFTGGALNKLIRDMFGEKRIEDLWLPYFCMTTDLNTSKPRVHQLGTIWPYVRASMSLAGYMPPLCDPDDGHLLVDGGYVNNLPADVMRSHGAKTVIAIDVGAVDDSNLTNYGDTLSGWWLLFKRWNIWSSPIKVPDMAEIQSRLAYVSGNRQLEEVKAMTDCFYMRPPIDKYKTLAFAQYDDIEAVGYHHGKAIISGWNDGATITQASSIQPQKSRTKSTLTSVRSFTDLAEMASKIEPPRVPPTAHTVPYISSSDDMDSGEDGGASGSSAQHNG